MNNQDYQIIHSDCLEVMKGMADKSVDLVLTDPPYEQEALTFPPITKELREEASKEIARVAKKWVIVFCQIEASHLWREELEKSGLVYRRTGIWVKPDGMPQYSGDRPGMGFETIVFMHVPGASKWNGGGRHGVFIFNKNDNGGKKALHPTTKPRELMKTLVDLFSNENDLILDPFAGSCTTLIACKQLNRRCICIEKEEAYVKIGQERFDSMTKSLFE